MILEEIIGSILDPVLIIVILALTMYLFNKKRYLFFFLFFVLIFGILPLNKVLNESLIVHDTWDIKEVKGFIILGGNNDRIIKGLKIAKTYPNKDIIFTGGNSLFGNIAQADKANFFLSSVRSKKILIENKSVNTYENAKFSYDKFNPGNNLYVLSTSGYHLKRSLETFKKVGWNIRSINKKDKNYNFFMSCCGSNPFGDIYKFTENFKFTKILLREYLALMYYRIKY